MFDRYLQLGSVPALVAELNRSQNTVDHPTNLLHADTGQGRRRASTKIGKGKLYYILSNPIYIGRIRHNDDVHEGEHEAIISEEVFGVVQARLAQQAPRARGMSVSRDIHLLNGLIFDGTGDRLAPIHATKGGKRYRYYISARLKDAKSGNKDGWRIPAGVIEAIVLQQLGRLFSDAAKLSIWMQAAGRTASIENIIIIGQRCSW